METVPGLRKDVQLSTSKRWIRHSGAAGTTSQESPNRPASGIPVRETPSSSFPGARGWARQYVVVVATIGAILMALVFAKTHGHHLLHDSGGYYDLSRAMAQTGLFNFGHASDSELFQVRTYGYPLFLALCGLFSSNDLEKFQWAVFGIQLSVFLVTAYYGSRTIAAALRSRWLTCPLYVCTALNPWLLLHSSELLTDLLSASLIYVNFALLLRSCLGPDKADGTGTASRLGLSGTGLGLFFLSGVSVMVRPANLILAPVTLALWTASALRRDRQRLLGLPILILTFALPFVPQVVNNYAISGRFKPLVVENFLQHVSGRGILYIKNAAGSDRKGMWLLVYKNPFLDPSLAVAEQSPEHFRRHHRGDYLLICATHGLCLFDQGTPFTYLTEAHPWYRWPSSLLSFAFLGVVLYGVTLAIRRAWRRGLCDRQTFASTAALLLSGCYLAVYLPLPVEARYGIPLFLLLILFFVAGLVRVRQLLALGRYPSVGAFALWLIVFVGCCAWLSAWIDRFQEIVQIG